MPSVPGQIHPYVMGMGLGPARGFEGMDRHFRSAPKPACPRPATVFSGPPATPGRSESMPVCCYPQGPREESEATFSPGRAGLHSAYSCRAATRNSCPIRSEALSPDPVNTTTVRSAGLIALRATSASRPATAAALVGSM